MTKDIVTKDQVRHIAGLSNITLSEAEIDKLQPQLSEVLSYVSQIGSINTTKVPETCQVTTLTNVYRQDIIDKKRCLSQEQALANAKHTHKGYIVVGAVINK